MARYGWPIEAGVVMPGHVWKGGPRQNGLNQAVSRRFLKHKCIFVEI